MENEIIKIDPEYLEYKKELLSTEDFKNKASDSINALSGLNLELDVYMMKALTKKKLDQIYILENLKQNMSKQLDSLQNIFAEISLRIENI